jgi:hypothetical protein
MESTATAADMDSTASVAAATAVATSAATAMPAASAATAAATGEFQLLGERGLSTIFLVECVKGRQAAVEYFLLTKEEFMRL